MSIREILIDRNKTLLVFFVNINNTIYGDKIGLLMNSNVELLVNIISLKIE